MNYELDAYQDALKDFPSREIQLETLDNTYYHFKTDTFKGLMSYSTSQNFGANIVTISAERAKEIIRLNKKGIKPDSLDIKPGEEEKAKRMDFNNVVGEDSLTRFDVKKKPGKNNNRNHNHKNRNAIHKNNGTSQPDAANQ
jgi:hypothetical protein